MTNRIGLVIVENLECGSPQERRAGGAGIQGHLSLNTEFEVSLGFKKEKY